MSFSEFFIRRPVTTVLINLAVIMGGVLAWVYIPVAALPRFDTPTISVSANMPGASPETMAISVALPLEKQFSSIAGLAVMSSSNTLGSTSITLEFTSNRDIDSAAADVQAALFRSLRSLPPDMSAPPSYRKFNPADSPILLLGMTSPALQLSQLNDYGENVIAPTISTVDGVAQVSIFGQKRYAVRIKIDPSKLSALNLTYEDVNSVLNKANSVTPLGTLNGPTQSLIFQVNQQLKNAADFGRLIVVNRASGPVRLADFASIEDSVETLQSAANMNGEPAIVLAVFRQPDANTVQAVDDVLRLLPSLTQQLPSSVRITPLNDRAASIREAIHDINITLLFTMVLVVLVIFLFLRRVMATIIPALSLPISLLGALALLYWGNNSLNNISLLGITLAVGLVVDDAIVVLENIVRHVEEGMAPFAAALKGASEMGFTIVSISLSLVAVLIPIFFMPGTTGLLFHEFAVTVGLSILVSAFVSLSLVPMLCSRFLSTHSLENKKENIFAQKLEARFQWLQNAYLNGLDIVLAHRKIMLLVLAASFALTVYLFVVIPKGFFPEEDIGQIRISTDASQDTSYSAMLALNDQVTAVIRADPAIHTVVSSVSASNSGSLFVNLKPLGQRPPMRVVIERLSKKLAPIAGIKVFFRPVQNLNIGGRSSKSRYQYTLQSVNSASLSKWAEVLKKNMEAMPDYFRSINTNAQNNALFVSLNLDYDQANLLGVVNTDIRSALNNAFGERRVSTIYTPSNSYSVIVQSQDESRAFESDLDQLNVRSKTGVLIPFSAFASVRRDLGSSVINHQGQLQSITLSFDTAPEVSLSLASAKVEELARDLPDSVIRSWSGDAATFASSQQSQWVLLLAALLVVYVLLGMLYESFIHPLTILAGLPSAAVGALIFLWWFKLDLTIIATIGILMLIGIVKKNAIMMVDYALVAQRTQGMTPLQAIHDACRLRFRPIMMTTLAALVGALPIAFGLGAGAELRQPLGIAVVGGLLISQVVTLFATPVIYLYLDRFAGKGVIHGDTI